jgi:hypothetical protein
VKPSGLIAANLATFCHIVSVVLRTHAAGGHRTDWRPALRPSTRGDDLRAVLHFRIGSGQRRSLLAHPNTHERTTVLRVAHSCNTSSGHSVVGFVRAGVVKKGHNLQLVEIRPNTQPRVVTVTGIVDSASQERSTRSSYNHVAYAPGSFPFFAYLVAVVFIQASRASWGYRADIVLISQGRRANLAVQRCLANCAERACGMRVSFSPNPACYADKRPSHAHLLPHCPTAQGSGRDQD